MVIGTFVFNGIVSVTQPLIHPRSVALKRFEFGTDFGFTLKLGMLVASTIIDALSLCLTRPNV